MRLLSTKSAKVARSAHKSYGSWKSAKDAGVRREDGVIVLKRDKNTGTFKTLPKK